MIGLTDGIEVDDLLASPGSGAVGGPLITNVCANCCLCFQHCTCPWAGVFVPRWRGLCGMCGMEATCQLSATTPILSLEVGQFWKDRSGYLVRIDGPPGIDHRNCWQGSLESGVALFFDGDGTAKHGYRGDLISCLSNTGLTWAEASRLLKWGKPITQTVEPTASDEATASGEAKTNPTDAYAIQKGAGPNGEDVAL